MLVNFFRPHLNSPRFDYAAVDQNRPQQGNLAKMATVRIGVCDFRQDHCQVEVIGR